MESMCVICNETFEQGEKIQTDCGHEFHMNCISEWVTKTDNCPLCRYTNPCGDKTYYYTFTYYFNNNKLNEEDKKRYNVFNKHVVSRYIDNRVYQLKRKGCMCGMCHLSVPGINFQVLEQIFETTITDVEHQQDAINLIQELMQIFQQ